MVVLLIFGRESCDLLVLFHSHKCTKKTNVSVRNRSFLLVSMHAIIYFGNFTSGMSLR